MYKIDTTSECGHIYINNPQGEHMSWKEVEQTLNSLTYKIDTFKTGNATLYATLQRCREENKKLKEENKRLKERYSITNEYRVF